MAIITRQRAVWEASEPEEPPALGDVRKYLKVLSEYDGELVGKLERARGGGRDDYPVRALWNMVAVGPLLGHARFSDLLGELARNPFLAVLVGYRIEEGRVRIPSKSNLSRFWKNLKQHGDEVEAILDRTVRALKERIPELGRRVAGDASNIRTHARPPKKQTAPKGTASPEQNPGGSPPSAEEIRIPGGDDKSDDRTRCADPDASWSVKTKTDEHNGVKTTRTEATFGYKVHAIVDQKVKVVLACTTTTGSMPDVVAAPKVLAHAVGLLGKHEIQEAAYDKAYDDTDFIEECRDQGIAPVIPVRDVPEDLKKQVPADREDRLTPNDNVAVDRYTGEVACYDFSSDPLTRRTMVYAGFEQDRKTHKFRCPLAAKGGTCPYRDKCGGGSVAGTGRQVRIPVKRDVRRFAPIYPRSKRWARAYRGRSSVERLFSIFKEPYRLEDHALRGKAAIHLRVLLAAITLNITTLIRVPLPESRAPERQRA